MKFDIPPTLPVPLSLHEGGTVRVGETRVTLDSVMGEYLDGATPETIADNFPTLDIGDIYATIAHYLRHREEVDAYLAARAVEAAKIRAENDRRFPSAGIRERLLRRRAARART